jgi:hypothetical protein
MVSPLILDLELAAHAEDADHPVLAPRHRLSRPQDGDVRGELVKYLLQVNGARRERVRAARGGEADRVIAGQSVCFLDGRAERRVFVRILGEPVARHEVVCVLERVNVERVRRYPVL